MSELQIRIDEMDKRIFCLERQRWIKLTPEEIVRQGFIKSLVEKYQYDLDQMNLEVKVKMGSTYAKKRALINFVFLTRLSIKILMNKRYDTIAYIY